MRKPRLYGLYRRVESKTLSGKPKRVYLREYPELAYSKEVAVRVFQNALLAGAFGGQVRELRPIRQGLLAQ